MALGNTQIAPGPCPYGICNRIFKCEAQIRSEEDNSQDVPLPVSSSPQPQHTHVPRALFLEEEMELQGKEDLERLAEGR